MHIEVVIHDRAAGLISPKKRDYEDAVHIIEQQLAIALAPFEVSVFLVEKEASDE